MQGLALMPNDRPEQNKNSKICLSPLWAHLGTISRASSRTSVRSEAKNHLKFFFSKIFLSPVRSGPVRWAHLGGWTSGRFHVLRVVLPSDRRKNNENFSKSIRAWCYHGYCANTQTKFPCQYTISPTTQIATVCCVFHMRIITKFMFLRFALLYVFKI